MTFMVLTKIGNSNAVVAGWAGKRHDGSGMGIEKIGALEAAEKQVPRLIDLG